MIIDAHCHAGTGDGLTGPWDTRASLDKYVHWASEAGIDRTVLLAAVHSDYGFAFFSIPRSESRTGSMTHIGIPMIYTTDLPALAILEITLHFRTGSIRNQLRLPLIMRNLGEIDFAIAFLFAACGQHASLTNAAIDKAFASLIC